MSGLSTAGWSHALLLGSLLSVAAAGTSCNRTDGDPVEAARRFVDTALALGEQPMQPTRKALVGLLCSERQKGLEKALAKVEGALTGEANGRPALSVADLVTGVRFPAGTVVRTVELASEDAKRARVLVAFEGDEGARSMAAVDLVMEDGQWRPCPPGPKGDGAP